MQSSTGTLRRSRRSGRIGGRAVVIETVAISKPQGDREDAAIPWYVRSAPEKTPSADVVCFELDWTSSLLGEVGRWGLLPRPRHLSDAQPLAAATTILNVYSPFDYHNLFFK
jgi:hypothetical protein